MDARNGRNKNAMMTLYRALGIDIDETKTVGGLWAEHNIRMNQGELNTENIISRINHMIIGEDADEDFQAIIEKYHPKLLCFTDGIDGYQCVYEDIDIGIMKLNSEVQRTV